MGWDRVLPEVQHHARLDRPPDVLVLHVGGNDLGIRPIGDLITAVKADVLTFRAAYPGMLLVWSDIIARTTWRMARSVCRLNKGRIKVNKAIGRFVARHGGLVIRHIELEEDVGLYLRGDGIHLSDVGMELWFLDLQEGIQRALRVWRGP